MSGTAYLVFRIAALLAAYAAAFLAGTLLLFLFLDGLEPLHDPDLIRTLVSLAATFGLLFAPLAGPAFAFLGWNRKRWWTFAVTGFVLTVLPAAFLFFDMAARHGFSRPWSHSLLVGLAGALGGLVFMAVFRVADRPFKHDGHALQGTAEKADSEIGAA